MFKPIIAKSLLDKKEGLICGFSDQIIAKQLTSKGILVGNQAKVIRTAPFGDNYYVKIENRSFGLRKEELKAIQVG